MDGWTSISPSILPYVIPGTHERTFITFSTDRLKFSRQIHSDPNDDVNTDDSVMLQSNYVTVHKRTI
jgi:hypothetical protein